MKKANHLAMVTVRLSDLRKLTGVFDGIDSLIVRLKQVSVPVGRFLVELYRLL